MCLNKIIKITDNILIRLKSVNFHMQHFSFSFDSYIERRGSAKQNWKTTKAIRWVRKSGGYSVLYQHFFRVWPRKTLYIYCIESGENLRLLRAIVVILTLLEPLILVSLGEIVLSLQSTLLPRFFIPDKNINKTTNKSIQVHYFFWGR